MSGAAAGAGAIMHIVGTVLGDQDVRERINRYKDAINLAPLDVNQVTTESLQGMESQFPRATALGTKLNRYNADELEKLLEAAYPGYGSQRALFKTNLDSWMRGEIPSDVSSAISRATAGKALFGGYGGTGLHRNLTARDLGRTSMGIQQQGMETFMRVPSAFPRSQQVDTSQLLGLSPAQLINLRARERETKQQMMAGFATNLPTHSGYWSNALTQVGGSMMGMGMMGGMGGGGSGGSGGVGMINSPQYMNSWDQRGYYEGINAPSSYMMR